MIPGSANSLLLATAAGAGGYQIERSLRFNSSDSAYLSRTPASAGNRKTWTWAGWVKRSKLGTLQQILHTFPSAGNVSAIAFESSDTLSFYHAQSGQSDRLVSTVAVFRDASAWYHIVFAVDTTQSTNTDRIKVYVNGVRITQFTSYSDFSGVDTNINSAVLHRIGSNASSAIQLVDGYLADIHFIDGQALDPTSFTEVDATTGQLVPKAYTGSYGTNGFHLDFSDNSAATATTLGADSSGNGNNWTPVNLTAGPATTSNSWSGYFDGSGDYLTAPNNTATDLGSGDFTVEAWVYTNSTNAYQNIVQKYFGPSNYNGWSLRFDNTGKIQFYCADGSSSEITITGTSTANNNTWVHAAVVRSGSTISLYVNGTRENTTTCAFNITATSDVYIGRHFNGFYEYTGYISNIRIVKGTAVYSGTTYTVPTTPLAAITNTSLLTLQSSTFVDNSANNFALTAFGNARVDFRSPFEESVDTDSLVDTPTNYGTDTGAGGEVRGNYATLNPLVFSLPALSNGNLDTIGNNATWNSAFSTIRLPSSGKWYWEVTIGHTTSIVGIAKSFPSSNTYLGNWVDTYGWYGGAGNKVQGPSNVQTAYASFAASDVVGVAYDAGLGSITFYKNGVSQGTAFSGLNGEFYPAFSAFGNGISSFNFGQRPFAYTAPSGFKALCTTNLPAPVVAKPSEVMDVALYTGDGTTSARAISGIGFSPDLVWIKNRNATYSHTLYDTVRGVGPNKALFSNGTFSEGGNPGSDDATYGYLSAFNSDGFSVIKGTDATSYTNGSSQPYVAWTWDAGSSTVTNTQGSITSQVRANPSAGFSVVQLTSQASGAATVGHGLGVAPQFIIVKIYNISNSWFVYHNSTGSSNYLLLDSTGGAVSNGTVFNSTSPTSTVYSLGSGFAGGYSIISYCFAPVAGYSSFGSYTGNGSTDGPFVYTGFRPAFILIKTSSVSGNDWYVYDYKREAEYNPSTKPLYPNGSYAEQGDSRPVDLLSNGFKIRYNQFFNASGATMIYAAFAESPFQYARAR